VDFEGHLADAQVKATLETLKGCAEKLKILGCYPQGRVLDGRTLTATTLSASEKAAMNESVTCPTSSNSDTESAESHTSDVASEATG